MKSAGGPVSQAERLLDRDPALAQEPGRAEVLHDGAEQGRGTPRLYRTALPELRHGRRNDPGHGDLGPTPADRCRGVD